MRILTYLIIAITLVACRKESALTEQSLKISITTATSKAMDKTSFVDNDVIDLYQWTGKSPNSKRGYFIYEGNTWINSSDLLWDDVNTSHFFISLYPKTDMNFDIQQNGYIHYDISSDSSLLCARVLAPGRTAMQGPVPLDFKYLASRLTVDLQYGISFITKPQVISLTLRSIGTVSEKLCLTSDNILGELSNFRDVQLYRIAPGETFVTHIIPQKIGELELLLDYNGIKLMYHKRVSLLLESGSTHNIRFQVNR